MFLLMKTFYHGTSSRRFREIASSGKINISSKVENTYIDKNLYATKTYYLSESGIPLSIRQILIDEENGIAKLDKEIRYKMNNLYQELIDEKSKELTGRKLTKWVWNEYANLTILIEVNNGNPTNDVVYLANREKAETYAKGFLIEYKGLESVKYKDNPQLQFGVLLKVVVDTNNLSPDLNDSRVDNQSPIPFWQQTYYSIGQCVHLGEIPFQQIEAVKFVIPESMSINDYPELPLSFNISYSLKEASSIIAQLR